MNWVRKKYRRLGHSAEPALPPLGKSPSFLRLATANDSDQGWRNPSKSMKGAFLKLHGIKKTGANSVSLVLPVGVSRARFLTDVQVIANMVYQRNHTWPERLVKWAREPAFCRITESRTEIRVNGKIPDSAGMSRAEQCACGWNDISLEDLASAHGAYFILTGKDLFNGSIVRAKTGALYFGKNGLIISRSGKSFNDSDASEIVFASKAL